jgi:hypothetical protein
MSGATFMGVISSRHKMRALFAATEGSAIVAAALRRRPGPDESPVRGSHARAQP